MGTMIQYLEKFGKYSFEEMPMTEVDSLVLCQLSYLKFDGMVPDVQEGSTGVTLKSVAEHPDFEKLFADVRYEKENRALFAGMVQGRRFRNMKLNYFTNVIEERWETQFSALTCFLDDGSAYVAFRGTDETIVGWKEDFNMAFLSPVPGQAYSVAYLNAVASRFSGDFYVGGHSKGGNLAVYSAMNCEEAIQKRILRIYSMDGPGFRPEVLERCGYDRIKERVVKILPHSSLVGMIFESDMHFQVVRSKTFGLLQHDPYTWQVVSNHLVRVNDLYERRKNMDNTLNEWILSLNEQQLRIFVDTLYQVIMASQATNLIEFTTEWKRSMNGIIAALKEVDGETQEVLKEIVKSLFEIARANRKRQAAEKAEAALKLLAPKKKPGNDVVNNVDA
ncbi:MAG: DUF2974 domain-containing protein [Lachnospiraceae bacterium]|jgi:hypothetical protein|nr:DUF2974 domain-containing protein [Lachnospiraceae bacterium]